MKLHTATILLTKTTATLSYHKVRGLYFLAVVFVKSIPAIKYLANLTFGLIAGEGDRGMG